MTKFSIGDKVKVDAQALGLRYYLVPNLAALIRADDYNLNATVTRTPRELRRVVVEEGEVEYTVAFDVAPGISNLVFTGAELELVTPVSVRKLDEAIAEAEAFVQHLKDYRGLVVNGF